MKGIYLKRKSWERQRYFLLDNGFTVEIQSSVYGDIVAAVYSGNCLVYHSSDGDKNRPAWLNEWRVPIAEGHWQMITVPKFKRIYSNSEVSNA